jgi:glycosyltransferase involved in cell wall biosynthesis
LTAIHQTITENDSAAMNGQAREVLTPRLVVAHVVLSLDVGGLERNVINQVREGRALGQAVYVICLEKPGALADQVAAFGGRLINLGKRPGIRISLFRRLRVIFNGIGPEIVHTHQIGSLFYAGPAVASLGRVRTRVVHTEHGREPYGSSARRRWLGRLAGLHVRTFFCLTHDMAAEIVQHRIVPNSKVRVIDNGIDIDRFRDGGDPDSLRRTLGIPIDSPVIGTIGRLAEVKCHDVLIRAFSDLRHEFPAAHLVIVGDGPLKDDLAGMIRQLDMDSSVHLAGYQPESWKYLYIMNCFALTSRSEGMPQAALEASIAGLPIVAIGIGGLPELIEDGRTGILTQPNDPAAITRALLTVLREPDWARQLGRAARERVESRFHVRRMAQVYHQHYIEILGPGSSDSSGSNSE